jgi:hypothetical protein
MVLLKREKRFASPLFLPRLRYFLWPRTQIGRSLLLLLIACYCVPFPVSGTVSGFDSLLKRWLTLQASPFLKNPPP